MIRYLLGLLLLLAPVAGASAEVVAPDTAALVARVLPSVVGIRTKAMIKDDGSAPMQAAAANRMKTQESFGSGFIVDKEGYVLTNRHVVKDAFEIDVILSDGFCYKASLVGVARMTDLALLRIKPEKPLQAAKFGNSDRLRMGEQVFAIGNPFGLGMTVTSGIVSALNRDLRFSMFDSFIQTDAAINHGNSGGPLFNRKGEVVGVNTAYYSGGVEKGGFIGIGYSIPSTIAEAVARLLKEYGYPRVGWLGVDAQSVTAPLASAVDLKTPRGAIVSSVDDKGPAAGVMRAGDIVLAVGRAPVAGAGDFYRQIAAVVDRPVDLSVWRMGKSETLRLIPKEWPDEAPTAEAKVAWPSSDMHTMTTDFGADVADITEDIRREFSLPKDVRGVVVTAVKPNSPAADHGVSVGDVVVNVQMRQVASLSELKLAVHRAVEENRRYGASLIRSKSGFRWVVWPLRTDTP